VWRGERPGREQELRDAPTYPERAPHPVHGRRDSVARLVGSHAGRELRYTADRRGERSDVGGALGVAPPSGDMGGEDGGCTGEAVEPQYGRGSYGLQVNPYWRVTVCRLLHEDTSFLGLSLRTYPGRVNPRQPLVKLR
jgi:hypothetical protein